MDQEQQQRYDRAHARVQAVKGFYVHASAYVLVNVALFVINLLVGGGWWFYWPLIGWGIGLGGARPGGVRIQRRRTLGPGVGGPQDQGVCGSRPGTVALFHRTPREMGFLRRSRSAPVGGIMLAVAGIATR